MSGLVDKAIGLAVSFVSGLFGKSKTNQTLDVLNRQVNILGPELEQQNRTLKWIWIGLGALAVVVVFFFILKRRRK